MFWATTLKSFLYQRARIKFQEARDWVVNWYQVWTNPLISDWPWLAKSFLSTPKSLNKDNTLFN